jgi:hypothetical protein
MAERLGPEFLPRCLAVGQWDAGAQAVHFEDAAWQALLVEFDLPKWQSRSIGTADATEQRRDASATLPGFGLGDAISLVATPIARALGLPCIDPATQDLKPESPCGQRRESLNKIHF